MKLHLYLITIAAATSTNSFAQKENHSVIAAAGEVSKSSDLILEWTLGEPAVESVSTSSSLYTQGFHQPLLEVKRTNVADNTTPKNVFRIFPNPATSILNIQINKPVDERLLVTLVDVTGKVLLNSTLPQDAIASKLDVSRYPHGTYVLRITNAAGSIHSEFKVIKAK
ncbi:T9SS type A sorting domain-containing protein [Segetibacter aerophilus]|uniref:Secretion system C-terminal sorting domain-containing protein n=1 Tax=Segetibacter aerophilus TaxID=670293 RepID=A0A512BIG1_9BACT|nr:T9SS type A sorting domain-containing protein [Segetibacter aerophilus]GEO11768.1 hypothetical protein SAE01_42640 [Segetibacter aerophilus]